MNETLEGDSKARRKATERIVSEHLAQKQIINVACL